jgi:hypothetical protein
MLDKHDSRITAAEMRFLGVAAGKTKWDRVRNVTIREELKQKPLLLLQLGFHPVAVVLD